MITKIREWCKSIVAREQCPYRLALSLALGSFIAFSPLVGFHNILVVLLSWGLGLSMPLLFLISCGINNPWTMVPIYATDHLVGEWILDWWSIDAYALNPEWVLAFNRKIVAWTGMQGISLWSFLLGGHLVSMAVGLSVYFVARYMLTRTGFAYEPQI